jgi:hypothetical protein
MSAQQAQFDPAVWTIVSSELEAAMTNLTNIRGLLLRGSFNRKMLLVIGLVALIIVVGVYAYCSYNGDMSSAVRNESPQAELNR